jgi:hypothetical protein
MKAIGFVQVIPERTPSGVARRASIARVTSKCPRQPLPGALIVRVVLDIPDELANVQTAEAAVAAGMLTLTLEAPE